MIKKLIALALVLCTISAYGSHIIETDNCNIVKKDIRTETPLGKQLSFYLFIPPNATKDTPAPAIVTSHGWYNNREMQDINYVELARRGYVVAAIDMYGHGNSDPLPLNSAAVQGTGMYDAVEILATLPYVDKNQIGVTGHSNGARAANYSVNIDNTKDKPLIKSVLLVGNDAIYKVAGTEYANIYGTRDVGIVAGQYDEFFFRSYFPDGTITAPRDYIHQDNAQSFLHFGKDPSASELEKRDSYTIYKENVIIKTLEELENPIPVAPLPADEETAPAEIVRVDEEGNVQENEASQEVQPEAMAETMPVEPAQPAFVEKTEEVEAIRVIYNPNQIHPWNHFSKIAVESTIDFFQASMPAPNPLPANDQVWPIKAGFNALGLVGFALFVVAFTKYMLRTEFFSSLLASEPVKALPRPNAKGAIWILVSLILCVIFSALSYMYLFVPLAGMSAKIAQSGDGGVFGFIAHQAGPLFIGIWSLVNALFVLLMLFIGTKIKGQAPVTMQERGVKIGAMGLIKTVLLALVVVFFSYALVFVADFFFKSDFRLWVLPIKIFTADKFYYAALYLPFFLIFYVVNSVAINCFNYVKGLPGFINVIILAIFNGASSALLLFFQYSKFFADGKAPLEVMFGSVFFNIIGIWLYTVVIFLPLFVFFSRSIFKDTKNPYIPAIIYAIIVTIVSVTNTLTEIPL